MLCQLKRRAPTSKLIDEPDDESIDEDFEEEQEEAIVHRVGPRKRQHTSPSVHRQDDFVERNRHGRHFEFYDDEKEDDWQETPEVLLNRIIGQIQAIGERLSVVVAKQDNMEVRLQLLGNNIDQILKEQRKFSDKRKPPGKKSREFNTVSSSPVNLSSDSELDETEKRYMHICQELLDRNSFCRVSIVFFISFSVSLTIFSLSIPVLAEGSFE